MALSLVLEEANDPFTGHEPEDRVRTYDGCASTGTAMQKVCLEANSMSTFARFVCFQKTDSSLVVTRELVYGVTVVWWCMHIQKTWLAR
jgi:hypothetical protein